MGLQSFSSLSSNSDATSQVYSGRRDATFAFMQTAQNEAVGSGKELRFKTGRLNGSALEVDGWLLALVLLRNNSRSMH